MSIQTDIQTVTLTTDFGLYDYYVAELKATLLSKGGFLQIVDVCHTIPNHDIVQASYFVDNIFRKFPKGSIHIVAVHHYYAKVNRLLIVQREGHYFIAPDNGLMSLLFTDLKIGEIYVLDRKNLNLDSFVDQYAHVVGYIKHKLPLQEIGLKAERINKKLQIEAVVTEDQIRATIIHVNHYDNVIVNLRKDRFEEIRQGRKFELYYKQNEPIDHLSRTYSDVPVGEVLALFNDEGYLEIAINMGKASTLLNLFRNETIQINFY